MPHLCSTTVRHCSTDRRNTRRRAKFRDSSDAGDRALPRSRGRAANAWPSSCFEDVRPRDTPMRTSTIPSIDRRTTTRGQAGFTLVEIMLVVAIIGIITAIATPMFLSYYQGAQVRVAAEEVATFLNQGRQLAIAQNRSICVHITTTAMHYHQGTCAAGATWIGPGTDAVGQSRRPRGITLSPTNVEVTFNYLGRKHRGGDLHDHAHAVGPDRQRRGGPVGPGQHHPVRRLALASPVGDPRGITLVEVIVAVGIITVGLSALLAAVPFASYGTREGYQLSTATFLANERLEQVRNARWESEPRPLDELGVSAAPTSAPKSGAVTTFADEAALPAPYGDYARAVRIIDCGSGGACSGIAKADLRQVTITVDLPPDDRRRRRRHRRRRPPSRRSSPSDDHAMTLVRSARAAVSSLRDRARRRPADGALEPADPVRAHRRLLGAVGHRADDRQQPARGGAGARAGRSRGGARALGAQQSRRRPGHPGHVHDTTLAVRRRAARSRRGGRSPPSGGFRVTVTNGPTAYERHITAVGFVPNDTTAGRRALQTITVTALNPQLIVKDPPAALSVRGELRASGYAPGGLARRSELRAEGRDARARRDVTRGRVRRHPRRRRRRDRAKPDHRRGGRSHSCRTRLTSSRTPRATVFDAVQLSDADLDALRACAKARGTYLQGAVRFGAGNPMPDGIIVVDAVGGGDPLPRPIRSRVGGDRRGGARRSRRRLARLAHRQRIARGRRRGSAPGLRLRSEHARPLGRREPSGSRARSVSLNIRDGPGVEHRHRAGRRSQHRLQLPGCATGGDKIPGRWSVKAGSYREVSS